MLALASLFSLGMGGKANATGLTLYWCYPYNGVFSTAAYWNTTDSACPTGSTNTIAPGAGDNLVFDNSIVENGSGIDPMNDITGLDVNSITFQGSGPGGYVIEQQNAGSTNAITVDNGITDIGTSGLTNNINAGINLNGNQTISVTGSDKLAIGSMVNLGSSNLTVSSSGNNINIAGFSGTGALIFASPSSGVAKYTISAASSSYSGPVSINSGANVQDTSGSLNGLGSGTITVNNGGSLTLHSPNSSGTLSNNLVLSGSGDGTANYGAIVSCLSQSCSPSNLNLSGLVTLNGNTEVVNGSYSPGNTPSSVATFNFTDKLTTNGHTLTGVAGSSTVLNLPANASGSSASAKAPGSPDSGEGLVSSHVYLTLIATLLISSGLIIIGVFAKRTKTAKSKK